MVALDSCGPPNHAGLLGGTLRNDIKRLGGGFKSWSDHANCFEAAVRPYIKLLRPLITTDVRVKTLFSLFILVAFVTFLGVFKGNFFNPKFFFYIHAFYKKNCMAQNHPQWRLMSTYGAMHS